MTVAGKGGRPAKPTELKLLHGEKRPSQLNQHEPKPADISVMPPDDMSDDAKVEWHKLAPDLIRIKLLTHADILPFREFCEAAVSAREAQHWLDEEGEVIDSPVFDRAGVVVSTRSSVNPWWKIRREASTAIFAGAARFGLTPADRARLSIEPEGKGKSARDSSDLLSG